MPKRIGTSKQTSATRSQRKRAGRRKESLNALKLRKE